MIPELVQLEVQLYPKRIAVYLGLRSEMGKKWCEDWQAPSPLGTVLGHEGTFSATEGSSHEG